MRTKEYIPNESNRKKKNFNEAQIRKLLDKVFKIMVMKMLTKLRKMDEQ